MLAAAGGRLPQFEAGIVFTEESVYSELDPEMRKSEWM
jgi:hypothetical protein